MADGQAAVQQVRNDKRDENKGEYTDHLDRAFGIWRRLCA